MLLIVLFHCLTKKKASVLYYSNHHLSSVPVSLSFRPCLFLLIRTVGCVSNAYLPVLCAKTIELNAEQFIPFGFCGIPNGYPNLFSLSCVYRALVFSPPRSVDAVLFFCIFFSSSCSNLSSIFTFLSRPPSPPAPSPNSPFGSLY